MKNLKSSTFKKGFIIVLLSAGLIWNVFQAKSFFAEWIKTPNFIKNNLSSLMVGGNTEKIEETRWNAFSDDREDLLSQIFYNRGYVLVDRFFDYLTFLSPRFYFQSGDGTKFSPPGVEPLAGLLFPFFILGFVGLIKRKEYLIFSLVIFFSFISFLTGQKTLAFLMPVLILFAYISSISLTKKQFWIIAAYSVFILGRIAWLK